ncbi:ATP-dependent DNA ligase [Pseudaminobacter sp. 19-2017]|uniref:ATP-dependent DNA ligase n=1 Tax=Pseudaminobacter soli (ex Zhang et al. 2022) TaxID=2831468 RepID=A0A942DY20_9HYPH|nr:RNA ligase family protein [Pseudaminobacter soli]MBS3650024.1 ATP-dependent DNA ligase [Pseudaminobacter soli]
MSSPPEGDDWIREIKWDGYRTQLIVQDGKARLHTSSGLDWTDKYRSLATAAEKLNVKSAIIDGEVILCDDEGKPDFKRLKSAIHSKSDCLLFMAFDLLHLNGKDVRRLPIEERRKLLQDLIGPENDPIRFSESFEEDAKTVFAAIDRLGLEGMVSKRKGSRYRSGDSRDWVKTKCYAEATLNIIGVQREKGKPAMVLCADRSGAYVGAAVVTFPKLIRERLWERVQARKTARPPKGMAKENAEWIKPGLIGRVRFLKGEEKLRHATLKDFEEQ